MLAARKCVPVLARGLRAASTRVLEDVKDQRIFMGEDALKPFCDDFKAKGARKVLVVTDKGIAGLGLVSAVQAALGAASIQSAVFDTTRSDPGVADVVGIAKAFKSNGCDAVVGLGGGGPLDATKGGMMLVAAKRNLDQDAGPFFTAGELRATLRASAKDFVSAVPLIGAIPTTAGTGSDAGKSAVITDSNGVKQVFGHPAFLPKIVALVPQFSKMPPGLTVATGFDAMFHAMEAYFVTRRVAVEEEMMNEAEIAACDGWALKGIRLVLENLERAVADGANLQTRLNMQIAAVYGAKAFRKGSLGGVHATAHALGAIHHLHHGAAIVRMAVPVLRHNESRFGTADDEAGEGKAKAHALRTLFKTAGNVDAPTLADAVARFQGRFGALAPVGIADVVPASNAKALAELVAKAAQDGCNTNPVALKAEHFAAIFKDAATRR